MCLSNDGYPASLEPRKIYVALRDVEAERNGLLRVVDESGEDYLYSRSHFAVLKTAARARASASRRWLSRSVAVLWTAREKSDLVQGHYPL